MEVATWTGDQKKVITKLYPVSIRNKTAYPVWACIMGLTKNYRNAISSTQDFKSSIELEPGATGSIDIPFPEGKREEADISRVYRVEVELEDGRRIISNDRGICFDYERKNLNIVIRYPEQYDLRIDQERNW
jgi:hypothetical protein